MPFVLSTGRPEASLAASACHAGCTVQRGRDVGTTEFGPQVTTFQEYEICGLMRADAG